MERSGTDRVDLSIALLCTLTAAGIWGLSFSTAQFVRPDAHDYAQMGRELAEGRGFSTLQVFPRHVPFLTELGALDSDRWPNLYRYPLPTLLHAAAQLVVGDPARAAVLQGGAAFALGVGVCFLAARRAATHSTALAATLVAASDPLWFESSYNGMSEAAALLIALLVFWTALATPPSVPRAAVLGALCGLGVLARTQLVVLLPLAGGAVLWWGAGRSRARLLVAVVVASAAVASPWLARNALVTGRPLFSFSSSRNLFKTIELDIDRDLSEPTSLPALFSEHPGVIGSKLADGFGERLISAEYWGDSLGAAGPAAVFVLLSFAWRRRRPPALDVLRAGALLLLVFDFGLLTLTFHNERFYAIPRVLLLVSGVCELGNLVRERTVRGLPLGVAVALLLGALGALRYAGLVAEHRAYRDIPRTEDRAYAMLAAEVEPDAVVASNRSARIALHAKRRSLRLPLHLSQLFEIDRDYLRIDYVAIPRNLAGIEGWYGRYAGFAKRPAFTKRYEVVAPLPNGLTLYRRRAGR